MFEFNNFIDKLNRNRLRKEEQKLAILMDIYFQDESVELFYPKNLYSEDLVLQPYIFRKNDVIILTYNKENDENIDIVSLKYSNITKLKLSNTINNRPNEISITIEFSNGESIFLSNLKDTDRDFWSDFNEPIEKVFKLLLSKS